MNTSTLGRRFTSTRRFTTRRSSWNYRWTTKYLRILATFRAGGVYKALFRTPQVFDVLRSRRHLRCYESSRTWYHDPALLKQRLAFAEKAWGAVDKSTLAIELLETQGLFDKVLKDIDRPLFRPKYVYADDPPSSGDLQSEPTCGVGLDFKNWSRGRVWIWLPVLRTCLFPPYKVRLGLG